jgi:hypothetical protein
MTSSYPIYLERIREAVSRMYRVDFSSGDTITVYRDNNMVYIHPDGGVGTKNNLRVLIDYSDVDLVKKVIEIVADVPTIIVDNDFGTVLPGSEFVARCRTEKGWDWRR